MTEDKGSGMQPPRHRDDGAISVEWVDPPGIGRSRAIRISHELPDAYGTTSSVLLPEHNAWRVFGMLAVMLGVKLPAKVSKGIKL